MSAEPAKNHTISWVVDTSDALNPNAYSWYGIYGDYNFTIMKCFTGWSFRIEQMCHFVESGVEPTPDLAKHVCDAFLVRNNLIQRVPC